MSKPVVVEADGGARGNPGPAGWGAVVRDADSGDVLAERSAAIGRATNNVAEYRGLIGGLEAAAELGATSVDVRMDSKLVIEQMAGRWQIRHPGLRPLAARAAALVRQFDSVTWTWVPTIPQRPRRPARQPGDGPRRRRPHRRRCRWGRHHPSTGSAQRHFDEQVGQLGASKRHTHPTDPDPSR